MEGGAEYMASASYAKLISEKTKADLLLGIVLLTRLAPNVTNDPF